MIKLPENIIFECDSPYGTCYDNIPGENCKECLSANYCCEIHYDSEDYFIKFNHLRGFLFFNKKKERIFPKKEESFFMYIYCKFEFLKLDKIDVCEKPFSLEVIYGGKNIRAVL